MVFLVKVFLYSPVACSVEISTLIKFSISLHEVYSHDDFKFLNSIVDPLSSNDILYKYPPGGVCYNRSLSAVIRSGFKDLVWKRAMS